MARLPLAVAGIPHTRRPPHTQPPNADNALYLTTEPPLVRVWLVALELAEAPEMVPEDNWHALPRWTHRALEHELFGYAGAVCKAGQAHEKALRAGNAQAIAKTRAHVNKLEETRVTNVLFNPRHQHEGGEHVNV